MTRPAKPPSKTNSVGHAKRSRMPKAHETRSCPTRSSSTACTTPASTLHKPCSTTPTTHGGVLTLFGSAIVDEGDASRTDGRFLNDLGELRQRADYGYGSFDEDVDALLARTRQFVSQVETLCTSPD